MPTVTHGIPVLSPGHFLFCYPNHKDPAVSCTVKFCTNVTLLAVNTSWKLHSFSNLHVSWTVMLDSAKPRFWKKSPDFREGTLQKEPGNVLYAICRSYQYSWGEQEYSSRRGSSQSHLSICTYVLVMGTAKPP